MDAAQAAAAATADLDPLTVAHHLVARASPPLQLPHVRQRWTEAAYVAWLDTHPAAEARALLQACVDAYAAEVYARGHKQYVVEYPAVLRLLSSSV
jgi:hypothetical protein